MQLTLMLVLILGVGLVTEILESRQFSNRIKEVVRYFLFSRSANEIHCITGMGNIQLKQMSAEGSEQWVVGVDVSIKCITDLVR